MYKVDLHTHSIISYDGGITAKQYEHLLDTGVLDAIAITDHNETRFAHMLQQNLGNRIIVGEEIGTKEGEIIGLYLQETVPPNGTALEAVDEILAQGGLVYIPHPFEIFRKGLQQNTLESIAAKISIMEVFNGRGMLRNKNRLAEHFAQKHKLTATASSDSHGSLGIGKTFSIIADVPTSKNLVSLLKKGSMQKIYAPIFSYFEPSFNKIKNKIILNS